MSWQRFDVQQKYPSKALVQDIDGEPARGQIKVKLLALLFYLRSWGEWVSQPTPKMT